MMSMLRTTKVHRWHTSLLYDAVKELKNYGPNEAKYLTEADIAESL